MSLSSTSMNIFSIKIIPSVHSTEYVYSIVWYKNLGMIRFVLASKYLLLMNDG